MAEQPNLHKDHAIRFGYHVTGLETRLVWKGYESGAVNIPNVLASCKLQAATTDTNSMLMFACLRTVLPVAILTCQQPTHSTTELPFRSSVFNGARALWVPKWGSQCLQRKGSRQTKSCVSRPAACNVVEWFNRPKTLLRLCGLAMAAIRYLPVSCKRF